MSKTEVAKMIYYILRLNHRSPVLDKHGVHMVDVHEWPITVFDNIRMAKMRI